MIGWIGYESRKQLRENMNTSGRGGAVGSSIKRRPAHGGYADWANVELPSVRLTAATIRQHGPSAHEAAQPARRCA
jgi:hypothetical protein